MERSGIQDLAGGEDPGLRCAASGLRVIVFAKAPVPGQVKTRLAVAIGDEAAAALAQRMLDAALGQAAASGLGPVELCAAPDDRHPAIQAAAREHGAVVTTQGEGDLGARMARAFQRVLASEDAALMTGTDCPGLSAGVIRQAAEELSRHDAVFVPARDGGYVLIGLRRFNPRLFEDIAWSTDQVMAATRERLRELRWSWWEGEPLQDVDEPDDLAHAGVDPV